MNIASVQILRNLTILLSGVFIFFTIDFFQGVCVLKLEIISTSILNMFILYNQHTHDSVDVLAKNKNKYLFQRPP